MGQPRQLIMAILLLIGAGCSSSGSADRPSPDPIIEEYVQEVLAVHDIPGLALGVLKDGKVLFEGYYGWASLEHRVPVGDSTLFRVYSSTKLIVNVALFQLLAAGKLSLDDELSKHLSNLPDTWKRVRIEHLLSHSSGIPDFTQFESTLSNEEVMTKLRSLPLDFPTGERFAYNQTNYWLLAQLIERLSGQSLEAFIVEHQFGGNASGVVFSSNSRTAIPNRVSKYEYRSDQQTYQTSTGVEQSRGLAGNGLNISLPRLIEWAQQLGTEAYLSDSTKAQMWADFPYTDNPFRFTHGWARYEVGDTISYGFTGGGVSGIRVFPSKGLTILLLTNGHRYYPVHNDLINAVAGLVDTSLYDEETMIGQSVTNALLQEATPDGAAAYRQIEQQHPNVASESFFNRLGYNLLRAGKSAAAIAIFKLNVDRYPESGNAYDSLGEAYLATDRLEQALKNYRQALDMNPESQNARRMVQMIEERLAD